MVRNTPPSHDASTHQIWNSYLKEFRRYAPDTKWDGRTDIVITIKTKSDVKVKVTVTRKWYATLRHPKMHSHTKFGIPTSKNKGDMHRTRSGMDGRTVRLLYASQSSFGGIKRLAITLMYCNRLHAWWSTQSRLATLLSSLIARRWVGLKLYDGSALKTSIDEMVRA